MQRRPRWRTALWPVSGILFLTTLLLSPEVSANEPVVAIRLVEGGSADYAVSAIERIAFEADGTLVVVTVAGSDHYPAASIARIDFVWGLTGADDSVNVADLVRAFHLFQNQPNPFSPKTQIGFDLPRSGSVLLEVHSLDGRLVRTLVNEDREAGYHEVHWNGRNDSGRKVSSGVYFYSLKAPGVDESRRMILSP